MNTHALRPQRATTLIATAFFVGAAVFLFAYPTVEDTPATGQVLGKIEIADMRPGEQATLGFWVNETFDRIAVSYNITEAAHIRMTFIDPGGGRIPGEATGDAIVLETEHPLQGRWSLIIETVDEPGLRGHIEHAWFHALGFGGPYRPA